MYLDKKIAFIGSGFMAGAMMNGIVKGGVCDADNIYVINEAFPESVEEAVEKYGVVHGKPDDIAKCDVVVFGVKPQIFPEAVEMYGEYLTSDKLYLSIMAGISCGKLESILGGARVVRLMPNMPLSVGASATVYALGSASGEAEAEITEAIFAPLGIIKRVSEDEISAVTALSGSGPAYFCRMAEAMTEVGIKMGLEESLAAELAVQTLVGTAETIKALDITPAELRVRVTSKKGTTEAALNAMTENDFEGIIESAMNASKNRSDELGS